MLISLSFDDNCRSNPKLCDLLRREEIAATFFLIAQTTRLKSQRHCYEGFEIGHHTLSHRRLTSLSDEEIEDEIRSGDSVFEEVFGKSPKGLAFPFGTYDQRVLATCLKRFDYVRTTVKSWRRRWPLLAADGNMDRAEYPIFRHGLWIGLGHADRIDTTGLLEAIREMKDNGAVFVTLETAAAMASSRTVR